MTSILIIESNTPDLLAMGKSASASFLRAFQGLAPELRITVECPYAAPLREDALTGIDGVVFSGSGVAWATDAAEAAPLRAAMEQVFDAGRPVWGSCNGLQLAAVVLGGAVGASSKGMEIGLAKEIAPTDAGKRHPMMAGREDGYCVPCIHRDEVQRLPEGAVLLAGNAHSPVQAMAYQQNGVDFWGAQYHPEMTALDVGTIIGSGAFANEAALGADLRIADAEPEVALSLGGKADSLSPKVRTRELRNWLSHVRSLQA
ncbi:type 1 glutamine amidotransferase [Shimia haliotis]|uniref:GMP synthase (Glutamine-hydrolysing) n=1 Tax=Shimia haliotis TaxID=1280847 RepID=A0A1I4DMF9_9RHOB|nr:type 1 glutamine amidotransferase [Shimia haliotis]SFK94283.1 GMP synthase (glutamine-hydrolysing) [Shimia haliotis]